MTLIPRRAAGGVSFRETSSAEVAIQTSHLASVSSSWNEVLEFVLTTESKIGIKRAINMVWLFKSEACP
jgi:hypothetical protein